MIVMCCFQRELVATLGLKVITIFLGVHYLMIGRPTRLKTRLKTKKMFGLIRFELVLFNFIILYAVKKYLNCEPSIN